jgi:glycosyltransferase involved in cell wall biosynthesis
VSSVGAGEEQAVSAQLRPAVSIVMPLYEKGATVGRAVASVLAQTVADFELVVVDDGSTDGGPAAARAFADPRVRVLGQANAGVSAARNRGIAATTGELVTFLDADDRWERDFLETILRLRKSYPSCAMFATRYTVVAPDGRTRPAYVHGVRPDTWEGIIADYFGLAAASEPPVWTSAVAITRAALSEAGGFPEGVSSGEDLLLWARVAARHPVAWSGVPKAWFWPPAGVNSRPNRLPQLPDAVGRGLAALLRDAAPARRRGLRRYVALWHRMRGVVWMHVGELERARGEFRESARLSRTLRVAVLSLLTRVPGKVALYRLLSSGDASRWRRPTARWGGAGCA